MTPKCPDCGRDQEDCSCRDTQNRPIPEGYKLVNLGKCTETMYKAWKESETHELRKHGVDFDRLFERFSTNFLAALAAAPKEKP